MSDSSSLNTPVYDIVINIIAEAYNFLYAYCEYRVEHNMV
jgi:hypothetical protein